MLLTTGIIISTLLLCVVASEFLTFKPAGASPKQQAIAQRQQNRFAEFYPGSAPAPASTPTSPIRLAGSAQNVIPVTAARSVSMTSPASAGTAVQSSPAFTAAASTTHGTQEQFYTPEIGTASESAVSSDDQSPVNVTINNSDLAPQLASLNARLDELSRQLAEKNNEATTERVFEYRIEDEKSVRETLQGRKSSEQANVTASPAAVSPPLQSVPTAPQIPVQISVAAPAPQPSQAPQIIVVAPPAYPWGMPPAAAPPVTPMTANMPPQSAAAAGAAAPPAPATDPQPVSRTDARVTKAEHQPRENSGTTNLFPLNLQMSLNLSPAANSPVANSEPEFMARPTPTELKGPSQDEAGASTSSTSLETFEDTFADDSAQPASVKSAPSAARQVSIKPTPTPATATASTVAQAAEDDVTPELFMPFEPIEPEPVSEPASEPATVQIPAKPEVPVHAPQPKETAVAMIRNAAVSEKTTEDSVPVLEPIFAPTIEPVSASKSSETEVFVPEPEPSEPDAPSNGPRVAPAPEPDPMFLTPSASSALPPQPLMTVPAAEFEPPQSNEPLPAPSVSETIVSEPLSVPGPVFGTGPMASPRSTPEKPAKRSRLSSMREAFSEAGEEVRERFDNLPRPSFEVPNWMEKFGSDSTSKPEAPAKQTPAAGGQDFGPQSSAGPRRFHDAQNATGKPGQAMLQGNHSAVARREQSRTTRLPTGSPRPASAPGPQMAMRAPSRQPVYVPTQPGNQPARVMTFNGPVPPRPSIPVPRFDTPDWVEDPPVQWPSPPVSQTAHRISSALRFAGQPKVVR
ncbi:MAG: hypothetical protein JNM43_15500 [Planctomycetaceae bacterium]|nr:hypothetical protein [Planctomycetaceae bacterium]